MKRRSYSHTVGLATAIEFVCGKDAKKRLAQFDNWMADWRLADPKLNCRAIERALTEALEERYNSKLQTRTWWDDRDRSLRAIEKALRAVEQWRMSFYLLEERQIWLNEWRRYTPLGRSVQRLRHALKTDQGFSLPRPKRPAQRPIAVSGQIRQRLVAAGVAKQDVTPLLRLMDVLPYRRRSPT